MRANLRASQRSGMLRLAGTGLLFASGGIHLDLYLTSYSHVPTIGTLFLLQFAAAIALGVALLAVSRPLVPAAAGVFALGTIVAYALSRGVGLFGFHERPTTAGLLAGLLELGAFGAAELLLVDGKRHMPSREGRPRAEPERQATRGAVATLLGPVSFALVTAALLGVVLAAGTGSPQEVQPGHSAASARSVVHVVIVNFGYRPAHVTAQPGETVSVRNEDSVAHTLTAVPGSTPFGHFDTGDIDPGRTKTFRAPEHPGSYKFYCSIHNFMTGVLTVS